jgi:O-antigen/teichoic acid export membrane protein
MSASATEVPIPIADSLSARVVGLARLAAAKGGWVMTDQAIVSLGNFLTANLLGRYLSQQQYGSFGLIIENLLFLNSLQGALIIYPYSVKGAADPNRLPRLTTASILFTLVLLPLLGSGMIGVAWAAGTIHLSGWILIALLFWQIQETLRRGLMSDMRFRDTIWGDSISYLGQAAIVGILAYTKHLTLGGAIVAIALTSAAAALIQAYQLRPRKLATGDLENAASEFWALGRWALLTSLLTIVSGSAYLWVLRFGHGLESVAVFMAILAMMKLTHPLMSSTTSLIVPAAARARARGGNRQAIRTVLKYSMLGLLLVPPYLFLFFAPSLSLKIFYGWHTPYAAWGYVLRIYVISYVLVFINAVAGATLGALERPQHAFAAQMVNVIITLLIGLPLTWKLGVLGLVIGGQLSVLGVLVAHVYWLREAMREGSVS